MMTGGGYSPRATPDIAQCVCVFRTFLLFYGVLLLFCLVIYRNGNTNSTFSTLALDGDHQSCHTNGLCSPPTQVCSPAHGATSWS